MISTAELQPRQPSLANGGRVDGGRREFDVIWVDARNKSVASDSDS